MWGSRVWFDLWRIIEDPPPLPRSRTDRISSANHALSDESTKRNLFANAVKLGLSLSGETRDTYHYLFMIGMKLAWVDWSLKCPSLVSSQLFNCVSVILLNVHVRLENSNTREWSVICTLQNSWQSPASWNRTCWNSSKCSRHCDLQRHNWENKAHKRYWYLRILLDKYFAPKSSAFFLHHHELRLWH